LVEIENRGADASRGRRCRRLRNRLEASREPKAAAQNDVSDDDFAFNALEMVTGHTEIRPRPLKHEVKEEP
jgi:hypothetical protein